MSVAAQAKNTSLIFLLISFFIRWGYNGMFLLYHGFKPMESAILHMVFSVISFVLAFMAVQLFRKSKPSGSNLGCIYVILLLVNFAMALGSIFAALIHLFAANGGEIEKIWLM